MGRLACCAGPAPLDTTRYAQIPPSHHLPASFQTNVSYLTDLDLSSFFSLHRPLSVTTTIPPPSSPESFAHIFEAPTPSQDPWANGNSAERRPEDVIYTLHNTIETLDSQASAAETSGASETDGLRWEVLQESSSNAPTTTNDGITHLDGPPASHPQAKLSLEELVANFRPFKAPPPPQAFPDEAQKASSPTSSSTGKSEQARLARQIKRTSAQRERQFQTTITFTESTGHDGRTVLRPHVSPLVRVADNKGAASIREPAAAHQHPRVRQPFLERMRKRQQAFLSSASAPPTRSATTTGSGSGMGMGMVRRAPSAKRVGRMLLISVKRQRKLKMKKHKYKKLMKRTRNLRRRLDRP